MQCRTLQALYQAMPVIDLLRGSASLQYPS